MMRNIVPRRAAKNLWAVNGQEIFSFSFGHNPKKGVGCHCQLKKIHHVNPLEAQAQAQEVTLAKKHFFTKTNF